MTVLSVFRSRTETMDFISRLSRLGVPAYAVNTPKEAGVGCGLSAKFDIRFFRAAKHALQTGGFSSFVGFYRLENEYGAPFIRRL